MSHEEQRACISAGWTITETKFKSRTVTPCVKDMLVPNMSIYLQGARFRAGLNNRLLGLLP